MKTIENQFFRKLTLLIFLFAALLGGAFAQFEPALNFDGGSSTDFDYIEVPDDPSLDFTSGFTFETWIRFDDISATGDGNRSFQGLFYKSTFSGSYALAFNREVNTLRFYHLGFGTQITDYLWTPVTGTWYHLAVTFDGTKTAIILDGVEVASQTATATNLIPNNDPLIIGASPNTSPATWPFQGSMEEVRMWNIARSATTINSEKDQELSGKETGLVLYYTFNEGTIGGDNTTLTKVIDLTLQENNGTLNGFALTGSAGNFVSSTDLSLSTPFNDQTITFNSLTDRTNGDADFSLSATSSSGFAISRYTSSDETIASISGSTVTIHKPGVVEITAFQDGDATTRRAEATQTLTINPGNPLPDVIVVDTLRVQVEVGKTVVANLGVGNNSDRDALTWSAAVSDTLGFGYETAFTKANFASWQLPENQDRITDNVYIARGDNKSIFNARTETTSTNSVSPADTEWPRSSANAVTSFDPFVTMHGGNPGSLVGDTATIHLITDDQYHEVVFSSFSGGNTGGGFGYTRTPMFDYVTLTGATSGTSAIFSAVENLEITFDATNLKSGFNYGSITLTTNDPANPTITVVAELEVLPSPVLQLSVTEIGDTAQILDPAVVKSFTISNPGPSELSWFTGADNRPAAMGNVTLDIFSGTVAAGGSQVVNVTFDNKFGNTGSFIWPLKITSNDVNNPEQLLNIILKLEGTPAATVVGNPSVLNLAETFVGFRSTANLQFANTGNDTLYVYNVAVDHPDITILIDSLAIPPFTPFQSLEFLYEPSAAGIVSGNMTYTTNDPTKISNTLPFNILAEIPPVIDVSPANITGSLTTSETLSTTVTVSNTGTAGLEWELVLNASYEDPNVVSFNKAGSTDASIEANQDRITADVWITAASGNPVGIFNYFEETTASGSTATIRWANKPTMEALSTDYGSFPSVATFSNRIYSLHLVAEDRYFDVDFSSFNWTDGSISYTRKEIVKWANASIAENLTNVTESGPGTQFTIDVDGSKLFNGSIEGSYVITSNDPLAPTLTLPINVTVTGGASNISTTATSVLVNNTQVSQTSDFSLEIINTGNAPLNVSNVTSDDPVFSVGATSFTVPVLGTYTLPLTFAPTNVQTYNANLTITSDDGANSPYVVSLTGTAVDVPDFQVSSMLIQETLAAGATSMQTLSIINNSAGDLDWSVTGEVAFEKIDYADPNTEAAQDRISDFVWFTRGDEKPTYNYLESTNYIKNHTSILYGNGTTFSQPTYGTFDATFNGSADGQEGNTTSLYLVEEDRYFDLAYSKWTTGGDGGGFAYTRREAVPWLSLASLSGAISGMGQTDVNVNFDATNLAGGDYEFTYDIATNDPANPMQTVTFQLHVTGTPDINVTFASDSVRFGDVIIGQTATMPVTVSNVGDSTLSVADIVFDNPAFSIDQTAFKVEKGKSVVLNVSFTPTTVVTYKAGFTITSDDPDESPVTFGVRGSGIQGADLNTDVTNLSFQVVAGGLGTADITLSNAGQQNLIWRVDSKYVSGTEVFFEKPESADWTQAQYQDRITDNVWITRRDDGSLFNIFEQNFSSSSNTIEWAENKTVITGPFPVYGSPLGDVFGGGSSMSSIPGNTLSLHLIEEDRYFDVFFNSWTRGNGNVGTGGFAYTRSEVATWLSVSEESGSIAVSGADQTLTITADAANLDAGIYTSNLVLGSNGIEEEQTVVVTLVVTGAPQIASNQSTLDFGNVIATTESTLELEISNTGNSALNVSDLSIDNSVFSVSNSPLVIEPGASTLVAVSFIPSLAQAYAGVLSITSDDGTNSPLNINLSGIGIGTPTASVDAMELRESLLLGSTSTQTFTIENTGSSDLIWSLAADGTATTFVNPNSDAVSFSIESGVLTAGSSQAVVATFNPSGTFSGTFEMPLQIVTNYPANTRIDIPVSLSINGIKINSTIADQLVQAGFGSSQLDITSLFTDAQGDALTYSVNSSDEAVVTVSELSDMVTVTEVGTTGTSVISITADDGKGTMETYEFDFRINAAPTVASAIGNQAYENAFGSADFDLSTVFGDTDAGDALNYSAMTDATGVVGTSIANSILTLAEQGPGTVNVTVTADDGFGGQVTDVFEVFVNKINQTITFNALTNRAYGDAAFDPGATATSNLTVSYSSSNSAVATTSGASITIVGAGTTTITASQAGDAAYNAALDVPQTLTVDQAGLTATADDQSKVYGAANQTFVIAYSGFVNGEDASVLDTAPVATTQADATSDVGTYAITPSGGVDNNYSITHVDGTLTVSQAMLTVTADNQTINKDDALPAFTVSYSGFVNGDDASVIDTAPTSGVSVTDSSVPGTYDIVVSGGSDNNYDFTYQSGVLTINQVLGLLNANNIKVYPNPVVSFMEISSKEASSIEIFDLRGTKVVSKEVNGKVDLTNLDTGSYIIQLRNKNNEVIYSGRINKN